MSSTTIFKCNFCHKELTDKSVNPEHMGVCLDGKGWTNILYRKIDGPHICMSCCTSIKESQSDMKAFGQ